MKNETAIKLYKFCRTNWILDICVKLWFVSAIFLCRCGCCCPSFSAIHFPFFLAINNEMESFAVKMVINCSYLFVLFDINACCVRPVSMDFSVTNGRTCENFGWSLCRINLNITFSLVAIKHPIWRSRWKAKWRSSADMDVVQSATMCTSKPHSNKSIAVCSTQMCASNPNNTTLCSTGRFKIVLRSLSLAIMLNSVLLMAPPSMACWTSNAGIKWPNFSG